MTCISSCEASHCHVPQPHLRQLRVWRSAARLILAVDGLVQMESSNGLQTALHPEWKKYALAQDFMSAEAFAARKQLKQFQDTVLNRQMAALRTKEEDRALAELVFEVARKEAMVHIQDTQAGLQQFLVEAADAQEVRFACHSGYTHVLHACMSMCMKSLP